MRRLLYNIMYIYVQIMRSSAGNVKRSKAEIDVDPEKEDDYGYTTSKYSFLNNFSFYRNY